MAFDWSVVSSSPLTVTEEGPSVPPSSDADWNKALDDGFYYVLEASGVDGADGMDNETSVNATETFSSPYLMPWPQRTSWIVVFSLMLLVATAGNALVAWIVFGSCRFSYSFHRHE